MNNKKLALLTLVVGILSITNMGKAEASDPCSMTLCMWGKVSGASGDNCNKEIRDFFSIKKTSKGSFLPDHTLDARKKQLNKECPAAYGASQFIGKILDKFGRVRSA
jgi:hypothetical protein